MARCVIVGGAHIGNYPAVKSSLRPDDFFIYCDCGLRHRAGLGREPGLIVGDFDSYENPLLPIETLVLPVEKDDTDTVYAAKEALRRGFDDFLLVGVVGGRFDHTFGNISLLLFLDKAGVKAALLDDHSEMEIVSDRTVQVTDAYPFFSLLAIGGPAEGVTVRNAKYPLEGAAFTCEYPYGVSNEPLPGRTVEISCAMGRLLLVKVFAP